MNTRKISNFFYDLHLKYRFWLRDGKFYNDLGDYFENHNVESQKKILNRAKKLLICEWEDPYFAAMRKYDDEYYVRVLLSAPLYGTSGFSISKHHIRSTTDDNVRRRYELHRGETDLKDSEIADLLMKELKNELNKSVPKVIRQLRKDIGDFIENWS